VTCFGIAVPLRHLRALGCSALAALLALAGLGDALLPAVSPAQHVTRHSGRVERVDIDEGVVVVSELAARGRPRHHAFVVGPETAIVSAARLKPWEMRGSGAYEEVTVSLVDLLSGDFVVVDSVTAGARTVALRITIVELRSPAGRTQ